MMCPSKPYTENIRLFDHARDVLDRARLVHFEARQALLLCEEALADAQLVIDATKRMLGTH